MSLLDTIEIQGVRSIGIGSTNAAVIEFLSPLTIICGPNGTGKTTIIESLKYATTGELPSGKMPVFIHDLRLANRTRVDASVKLKFKDILGRPCIVTRRMTSRADSLKSKVTTKSEESTIAVEKDPGEWKSLSSKVIDTKKEILNLLGVPAAILEYVVFCHQDESTWPLDEPKKLKERFDEIFQVTSYVKSIDALKKIQKQNQQDLHTLEATLPHLVRQQESKAKLCSDLTELNRTIEENAHQIEEKALIAKQLKDNWDSVKTSVLEAEEAERNYKELEKEIISLNEQVEAFDVPDYQGTIGSLEKEIEAYKTALFNNSEDCRRSERDRDRWKSRLDALAAKTKLLASKKERLQNELGELKASEIMRDRICKEREDFVKKLSARLNITNESEIERQIEELHLASEEKLAKIQNTNKERESVYQKDINNLNANLAVVTNQIELKLSECIVLKNAIRKLDQDLLEAKSSMVHAEETQERIQDAERELEELSASRSALEMNEQLKEEKQGIASKLNRLREECRKSEAVESLSNALGTKRNEVDSLEAQLKSLVSKHKGVLCDVFNNQEPEFPLKKRLSVVHKNVTKAVTQAENDVRRHENEKNKLISDAEHFMERINHLSDEMYSYKSKIEKVLPSGESVEARLAEVDALLNKSRNDLGLIDGCRFLYEEWEREAKERKCCPLCERKYKAAVDTDELVTKINRKRSELPVEIKKLQKRVKEHEELHKELIEVAPYAELLENSQKQKVLLEEELRDAKQKVLELDVEVKKSTEDRNTLQEKQGLIFAVQADASLMDNIWEKHRNLLKEINKLSVDLEKEGVQRSLIQIRGEIDELEKRHNEILAQIDSLHNKAKKRNEVAEKLNALRAKHLSMGKKAMQVEGLEKTLGEKKNHLEDQLKEIDELKKRKPIMNQQLQSKIHDREKFLEDSKLEEVRTSGHTNDFKNILEKLISMEQKLLESQDISTNLAEKQKELCSISEEIDKNNEENRVLTGKLDNINAQQERGRRLETQLRKMRVCEKIQLLAEKKKKVKWGGKPINELKKLAHELEKQCNELTRSVERKTGEIEQKKIQAKDMKKRLNSKEFVNSEEEYKRTVITKCVTEKVVEDLTLYIRILDESVVKYHAEKMEEINEVLGQLWDQVYRGGDIETIRIKSETVDESEKKKSYNYRVVMTVDGSEIDMPGRCSAGQKMLASILIRIALSDVFCDKCSIIALDEPTTNLDVLKVENLGDVLAQIIEARCSMSKKNFQLIIITHDDRFVEHLRQLCRPEWVYALSKDSSGLSRVKRHKSLQDAGMHAG